MPLLPLWQAITSKKAVCKEIFFRLYLDPSQPRQPTADYKKNNKKIGAYTKAISESASTVFVEKKEHARKEYKKKNTNSAEQHFEPNRI